MARAAVTDERIEPLDAGWTLAWTPPAAVATPADLDAQTHWIAATVPGTVASALAAAGLWHADAPTPIEDRDHWYRTTIAGEGRSILRFQGLATLAEVYLDDALILRSDNMFLSHDVDVTLSGTHELHLCFRALAPRLAEKRRRPRWRTRVVDAPNLRFVRTSLLGRQPGWCLPAPAVGPYRLIEKVTPGPFRVAACDLRADLVGTDGVLDVRLVVGQAEAAAVLHCAGMTIPLAPCPDGSLQARLVVPQVAAWWPHTHGTPHLHDVHISIGSRAIDLGRVGFRRIAVDRGADSRGFGLVVNDVPVFCRGAAWTSADLVGLAAERETYAPLIGLMRDAGMNMVRVSGNTLYESDAFYALCDALGLMVWQDFMFASLDYPADDEAFAASVDREARQFLARTQTSPSIAVLCGGSEMGLQAAMFGLPEKAWSNPLFTDLLAAAARDLRPDAPYVSQTPFGGELPFVPHAGTSHYYGVTAHKRPLDDARRAGVRFATECLCLANVPDLAPAGLEPDAPRFAHPHFGNKIEGDTTATWYFEEVRNHYLELLYGVDAAALRQASPEHFIALSKATSAEVMEAVIGEWRRAGSLTRGALVWFFQDVWAGPGWGVVDSLGEPKAAYWGLKRAMQPVTVILTDEGLNGLRLHLVNDGPHKRRVTLRLTCLKDGATPVMNAARDIDLHPHSTVPLAATELWGGFFDTTYAFRFGPPAHDVTAARLLDRDSGATIADAFHFPLGRGGLAEPAQEATQLQATLHRDDAGWWLDLATDRFAPSIQIVDPRYRASDNWFHLAPGLPRRLALHRRGTGAEMPCGHVVTPDGSTVSYGASATAAQRSAA